MKLSHRCVLATDIERYGTRSAPDQREAQRVYELVMAEAAEASDLRREDWIRQRNGDGELAILPEGVYETRLVGVFLAHLADRLRDYNRPRHPDYRVRLRVAVDIGLIQLDGPNGFPGRSVVTVCRLVNAEHLRSALHDFPDANVGAIVSAEIHRDVVLNQYDGARPELFRPVTVEDRAKGFCAPAWVYLPEVNLALSRWPDADRSRSVAEARPLSARARLWLALGGVAGVVGLLVSLSAFVIR